MSFSNASTAAVQAPAPQPESSGAERARLKHVKHTSVCTLIKAASVHKLSGEALSRLKEKTDCSDCAQPTNVA